MEEFRPASLAFDEVRIDLVGHRLWCGGETRPLEPKAFGVLALLAQSPGRVFTRDEILDAVWGHRHVTPGVLNRVMTLLRHALGEDAHAPRYLHTVHGVGYRFDAAVKGVHADEGAGSNAEPPPRADELALPRRRASDRRIPNARRQRIAVAALVLAVLAAIGWAPWGGRTPTAPLPPAKAMPAVADVRSIAVLPLRNASDDAGQQFFSDGLSETLIGSLARFEGLRVIGRTSAFRFRDASEDSASIGRKLGAAFLLAGSVQRAGDVVRIRVTLVRAADGSTLWSEQYDRPYRDLFALQDEIALAVAGALHARLLTDPDATRGDRPPGGNIEAYNAYLRGLQAFNEADLAASVAHLEAATRLDDRYAMAWAQQSVSLTLIGQDEEDAAKARSAFARSRVAVDRALALDPDLGLAHAALGNLLLGAELDWSRALAEFRRGAQLAPEIGRIHGGLSRALAANGRLQEAMVERRRFLGTEPLFAFNYFAYAGLLMAAGRLDEAEDHLRIGEGLQKSQPPSHLHVHLALLRGDAASARTRALAQSPRWRAFNLALAAQLGADRSAADEAVTAVLGDVRLTRAHPYAIAQLQALRGDAAGTVRWLERAWSARDPGLHQMLYDPLVLRFRKDPRLVAFCRRVGLPPPDRSEALGFDEIRARLATPR